MPNTNSDELNLEPFVKETVKGAKNIAKSTFGFSKKLLNYIWLNKSIFFVFVLIFASFGYAATFFIAPEYKVKMGITTSITGSFSAEQSIDNLEDILEDKNFVVFSEKIGLPIEKATKISSIQIEFSDDLFTSTDTNGRILLYYISVLITDQSFLPELQQGVFQHLKENFFIKRGKISRIERQEKLIENLKFDVVKIDSILNQIAKNNYFSKDKNTFILKDPINPTELLKEKNRLVSLKVMYENNIKNGDDIQMFSGFDNQRKPYFPKKLIFLLVGALVGFLAAQVFIRLK